MEFGRRYAGPRLVVKAAASPHPGLRGLASEDVNRAASPIGDDVGYSPIERDQRTAAGHGQRKEVGVRDLPVTYETIPCHVRR